MTIEELYQAACLIKHLVEENDRLKEENYRLRQSEKENRTIMSTLVQQQQDLAAQTIKTLIHYGRNVDSERL